MGSHLDLADQREADLLMGRLAGHLLACAESCSPQCEFCQAGKSQTGANGAGSAQTSRCCVAKRVASLELPAVGREDFLAALGGFGLPDGCWGIPVADPAGPATLDSMAVAQDQTAATRSRTAATNSSHSHEVRAAAQHQLLSHGPDSRTRR